MDDTDFTALRFVNSIDDDGKTRVRNTFSDHAGLLDQLKDPAIFDARTVPLDELMSFREDLFAVLSAAAAAQSAPGAADVAVRTAIATALSRIDVSISTAGLALSPGFQSTQIDVLALSAYGLMISDDFARLSECHRCTRLFIDRGRGKGRRWCDMSRCGNRAKAESYRARRRAEAEPVR